MTDTNPQPDHCPTCGSDDPAMCQAYDSPAHPHGVNGSISALMIPDEIWNAYAEDHRHYHTLEHVASIISKIHLFQEFYGLDRASTAVLTYAAWYHDAVYWPGSSVNELESGLLWQRDFHQNHGYWDVDADAVYQIILGTKSHRNPSSFLSAIFFDLDLADMGYSDRYVENSYKIREEFSKYSDLQWLEGRKKFLSDFLGRNAIFHTSMGYRLWEETTRMNMSLELSYLKGKYGDAAADL